MQVTKLIQLYSSSGTGLSVSSMINNLNTYGPYTTYLYASSPLFQGYKSGILNNTCCWALGDNSKASLGTTNHAIVTVGYGIASGKSYWIMRNSWGPSWGESGYIRMTILSSGVGVCGNQQMIDNITML